MAVKRFDKALTDETLQSPPKSLKQGFKEPGKSVARDVLLTVERVEGCCPEYLVGGEQVLFSSFAPKSLEHICAIASPELYPYIEGLTQGATAVDMGIACEGEDGFTNCAAWGCPTCEAKVVFRLHPIEIEDPIIDTYYEYLAAGEHHCAPEYFRETFSSEETIQQHEDLMEEWDKAGRPLFWDKWGTDSKLKKQMMQDKKNGVSKGDSYQRVIGRDIFNKRK